MEKVRAKLIETGNPQVKSGRIVIEASRSEIFEILATPRMHPKFDGSGTVKQEADGPDRLSLGAKFGMQMRIKIPYRITNTCIEFDEGRLIGWRHFGHHIWRYELREISAVSTEVTETFDARPSIGKFWLRRINAYSNNQVAILKTLVRLKKLAEACRD